MRMSTFKIGNQVEVRATKTLGRVTAVDGDKFMLLSAAEGNPTIGPFAAEELELNTAFITDFSILDDPNTSLG